MIKGDGTVIEGNWANDKLKDNKYKLTRKANKNEKLLLKSIKRDFNSDAINHTISV